MDINWNTVFIILGAIALYWILHRMRNKREYLDTSAGASETDGSLAVNVSVADADGDSDSDSDFSALAYDINVSDVVGVGAGGAETNTSSTSTYSSVDGSTGNQSSSSMSTSAYQSESLTAGNMAVMLAQRANVLLKYFNSPRAINTIGSSIAGGIRNHLVNVVSELSYVAESSVVVTDPDPDFTMPGSPSVDGAQDILSNIGLSCNLLYKEDGITGTDVEQRFINAGMEALNAYKLLL